MSTYNPEDFIKALALRMNNRGLPNCPYCGGQHFTTTDSLATIMINKEDGINLGPYIPSGMAICKKCGHIEFFALKVLGLMSEEDFENNAEKE